jgi:acetoin utilization protein AcuB
MKTAVVMTREVVVVSPSVSLSAARHMMARLSVRHLPVVEAGHLVGVLSDRDVLRHEGAETARVTCGEAMTPGPLTCNPDSSVAHVAALMLDHKIDSVPVVDARGHLVGLVTSSDLLSLLLERAQEQVLPFDFRLRVAHTDGDALVAAA